MFFSSYQNDKISDKQCHGNAHIKSHEFDSNSVEYWIETFGQEVCSTKRIFKFALDISFIRRGIFTDVTEFFKLLLS